MGVKVVFAELVHDDLVGGDDDAGQLGSAAGLDDDGFTHLETHAGGVEVLDGAGVSEADTGDVLPGIGHGSFSFREASGGALGGQCNRGEAEEHELEGHAGDHLRLQVAARFGYGLEGLEGVASAVPRPRPGRAAAALPRRSPRRRAP